MRESMVEKNEREYIADGIKKYGYDGFWKLIEMLNKRPKHPVKLPMIRRQFPKLP